MPTWSGNPINTAWALFAERPERKRLGRCIMAVNQSTDNGRPEYPSSSQTAALSSHKEVVRVVTYLWIVVILCMAWFGIIYGLIRTEVHGAYSYGVYYGSDWAFIPDSQGTTSILQVDTVDSQAQGVSGDPQLDNSIAEVDIGITLSLLLVMTIQAFLTMALHCAELIVNSSRDEDTWRRMTTKNGNKDTNVIVSVLTSWKALLLLATKPFLHWIFGMSVKFFFAWGIFFRPPQILYLGVAMLLFACFPTALSFYRPKGQQPATYGHLQTLIDLIDIYDEHLWWGDKTAMGFPSAREFYSNALPMIDSDVQHAGTWGRRLPSVQPTKRYA